MTQNVVTYTVEVVTDNSSGKLLPYLTANVQFEVARRANVLWCPTPPCAGRRTPQQVAPEFRGSVAAGPVQPKGSADAASSSGSSRRPMQGRPGYPLGDDARPDSGRSRCGPG